MGWKEVFWSFCQTVESNLIARLLLDNSENPNLDSMTKHFYGMENNVSPCGQEVWGSEPQTRFESDQGTLLHVIAQLSLPSFPSYL